MSVDRVSCPSCEALLEPTWLHCPYCGNAVTVRSNSSVPPQLPQQLYSSAAPPIVESVQVQRLVDQETKFDTAVVGVCLILLCSLGMVGVILAMFGGAAKAGSVFPIVAGAMLVMWVLTLVGTLLINARPKVEGVQRMVRNWGMVVLVGLPTLIVLAPVVIVILLLQACLQVLAK